jgi:hypothetical protein
MKKWHRNGRAFLYCGSYCRLFVLQKKIAGILGWIESKGDADRDPFTILAAALSPPRFVVRLCDLSVRL